MLELRLLFRMGVALAEATFAAFLLTLIGPQVWLVLLPVVLAGTLFDLMMARRKLPQFQYGAVIAGAGLLVAALLGKSLVGGGLSPLSGWDTVLTQTWNFYSTLLVGMYAFWRGSRVLLHDSISLQTMFRWTMLGMLVPTGIAFFDLRSERLQLIVNQVIGFYALMLTLIPLARAISVAEQSERGINRRTLSIVAGSLLSIVGLTLLMLVIAGEEFRELVVLLLQGILLIPALLVSVIAGIVGSLLAPFIDTEGMNRVVQRMLDQLKLLTLNESPLPSDTTIQTATQTVPWWLWAIQIALCLVPVAVLVIVIMVVSRRANAGRKTDEARTSLMSVQALMDDMGGLFGRRTLGQEHGLRRALSLLRGSTSAERIRRAYIQLLLLAQQREQARLPTTTPREFATAQHGNLPPPDALDTLTGAYELARYHPQAVADTDAERAEHALKRISAKG